MRFNKKSNQPVQVLHSSGDLFDMILKTVFLLPLLINFGDGANILAIVPTPSFSHQVAFTELWKELSLRGHRVTLVTTDPRTDPNLSNLKEIDMKRSYKVWSDTYSFSEAAQDGLGFWNIWEFFLNLLSDICEDQLNQPEMQDLIHGHDKYSFDLVILEVFFPELLAFGKIYNCPTMLVATIDSTVQMYQYLGNPAHPVLNSDINVPYFGEMTFRERVISSLYYWNAIYFEYFTFLPRKQKIVDKFFGNVTNVRIEKLISDIDLMLVNVNPLLKGPRALGPTTVSVGGGNHLKPIKPLPKELKEYLDEAKDGFIYFSLGGNVKSKDLRGQTMTNIIETLKELPYKVLWKFEADELPGKPENIKLIKWAPQQDILRHQNIKLFISQGGIQSMEEAIYTNVPLLIIPFYGDQLKNARIVEYKGFGKCVNHKPYLKKDELKSAIIELIQNPKYKEAIKELARLMQDQPMTGLQTSVWWTEHLIRNKGARHLRNPAVDLPLYQYYLVDVIAFIVILSALIVFIALKSLKIFARVFIKFIKRMNKRKLE